MELPDHLKTDFSHLGFAIINDVYSTTEVDTILHVISQADISGDTFRKSGDLFAIRQFLKGIPGTKEVIFNDKLVHIIESLFGYGYFVTKSIYFDKPGTSNWFVAYHQDLTISVDRKINIEGYGPWTVKHDQYAVQPPVFILDTGFTIRIHLDDTTKDNGALHVIPGSHKKGIHRPGSFNLETGDKCICEVGRGGIMLMSPLLLHASGRTINNSRRRVIHIEFNKESLPEGLRWAEYLSIKTSPCILPN